MILLRESDGRSHQPIRLKGVEKVLSVHRRAILDHAAPTGEQPDDPFRRHARFPVRRQSRVPVALGQTPSVRSQHERQMPPSRGREAERPVDQRLPRCRRQQVVAPHDGGDVLAGVVHRHRELVGRLVALGPEHEVADLVRRPEGPGPGDDIIELNRLVGDDDAIIGG